MVIVRDALRDLLYPRHTLHYLHRAIAVQFPLGSQDQSPQPAQGLPSSPADSEACGGGRLNFQFNGITVVSPGGSISPSGTKTSRPAEHHVGTESRNSPSGSLGGIVNGAIPTTTP